MLWVLSVSLFVSVCGVAQAQSPNPRKGIYPVHGVHSINGNYRGEIEIRPRADGRFDVVRVVNYETLRFDGFRVAETWVGRGVEVGSDLEITFILKQADVFLSVGAEKRAPEQFSTPLTVKYVLSSVRGGAVQIEAGSGTLREIVSAGGRALEAQPLWRDLRQTFESFGDSFKTGSQILTSLLPIIEDYRQDPVVRKSLDRPECASKSQRLIHDPTDFEALRAEPDLIRVNGKVLDTISLTEAALRRDAYGPTLAQKARTFDEEMRKYYLNDLGLFTAGIFGKDGQMHSQWDNGDGALWSGMYAGAQAMRYKTTGEAEALEAFKRTTRGLMFLMDVTGDPKNFARTAHKKKPGENVSGSWRQGQGAYADYVYLMTGNNDMYKGLVHAFAWAYQILPVGDAFLTELAPYAARLTELDVVRKRPQSANSFLAKGLRALATGKGEDVRAFTIEYATKINTLNLLGADDGYYYAGIADWSGTNLSMVGKVTLILITNNVVKRFERWNRTLGLEEEMVQSARTSLMDFWGTYAKARRGYITIAAHALGLGNAADFYGGTEPTKFKNSDLWNEQVAQAIWFLREVPAHRYVRDIRYDHTLRADFCMSWWPTRPWKVFSEKNQMPYYYQGAINYPMFEGVGLHSDQLWKEAFGLSGHGAIEGRWGRADYLHAYWMARLSGMISDRE